MLTPSLDPWTHDHVFLGREHERNERRTWIVVALTGAMMIAEIAAGSVFNSMALLADGWHMATHAGALGVSALAYRYARRHARSPRFTFGTGKVGDLAGWTSAVVLAVVALLIGWEAIARLRAPLPISFDEAIAVAVLGLAVNVASAAILRRGHGHDHDFDRDPDRDVDHEHQGHRHGRGSHSHADHNLRAAYLHVLADALTSLLAIGALVFGRWLGAWWLDPLMGVVGAVVIARWSVHLLRDTGRVLLDVAPDERVAAAIRRTVEARDGARVSDLHLWRVGPGHVAAIVSVVTERDSFADELRSALAAVPGLAHLTVEVRRREAG